MGILCCFPPITQPLFITARYVSWNDSPLLVARSERTFNHYERSALLMRFVWEVFFNGIRQKWIFHTHIYIILLSPSNCQSVVRPLIPIIEKAHRMFSASAYIHQYESRGVDKDLFRSCFTTVSQCLRNYGNLWPYFSLSAHLVGVAVQSMQQTNQYSWVVQ
jgi:hypothetical protein